MRVATEAVASPQVRTCTFQDDLKRFVAHRTSYTIGSNISHVNENVWPGVVDSENVRLGADGSRLVQ